MKAKSLSKSTKKTCVCRNQAQPLRMDICSRVNIHQKKNSWGCFTYIGPGILIPTEGMSNSETYINYNAALFQL